MYRVFGILELGEKLLDFFRIIASFFSNVRVSHLHGYNIRNGTLDLGFEFFLALLPCGRSRLRNHVETLAPLLMLSLGQDLREVDTHFHRAVVRIPANVLGGWIIDLTPEVIFTVDQF